MDKARIDRTLIAALRENSRPLRPEASLTRPAEQEADLAVTLERTQSALRGLVARIEMVEGRLRRMDAESLAEPEVRGHTLFVPTASGYFVVERDGPAPRAGEEVVVDGATYRVQRYRRSPFPGDRRYCVVVELAG